MFSVNIFLKEKVKNAVSICHEVADDMEVEEPGEDLMTGFYGKKEQNRPNTLSEYLQESCLDLRCLKLLLASSPDKHQLQDLSQIHSTVRAGLYAPLRISSFIWSPSLSSSYVK